LSGSPRQSACCAEVEFTVTAEDALSSSGASLPPRTKCTRSDAAARGPGYRPKRRAPVLQRVGLEYEVMMRRRAGGEALDDRLDEIRLLANGTMVAKARVMFQLQECEVVG
jgi:hypothetical protein